MSYQDIWYQSGDGLQLYARDYAPVCDASVAGDPVLCMHGLTRNSADFGELCSHLAPRHRVIAVDQRGRGRSAYDSNIANYNPQCYAQDMLTLLRQLGIPRVILIGTSLGGLMAIIMTALEPRRISAVVLNDVGPDVNPRGLERIIKNLSGAVPVRDWDAAVARTREIHGSEYPDLDEPGWRRFAANLYRENDNGLLRLDHDPAIFQALEMTPESVVPAGLWPQFDSMSAVPTLLFRGETSDILTRECVAEMQRRKPDLVVCEVPRVGHAPLLTEAQCLSAIDHFLVAPVVSMDAAGA